MNAEPHGPLDGTGPKQQQIVRLLRTAIEAGSIRDGDVLPSTRQLAEDWHVSVFTISEAMKALAAEGYVVNVDRTKRVARNPNPTRPAQIERGKPTVVWIAGYAGSGKTEFGRILARQTGWPILDKDTTTRPVVELALEVMGQPTYDRESQTYIERIRPREYEALMATVIENLDCGASAIVTAPFLREFRDAAWLKRAADETTKRGAQAVFVWIRCDLETMHTYLRNRGAARDNGKLQDWKTYAAGLDLDFAPPIGHAIIDNSTGAEPLTAQAGALLESIDQVAVQL